MAAGPPVLAALPVDDVAREARATAGPALLEATSAPAAALRSLADAVVRVE